MANRQATEFTERVVGSLDDPAASVAAPLSLAASIGRDQLDAAFVQTLPQRVRIIGSGGNPSFRPLPGRAFGARDADFDACPFRKTTVSLSGSLWPNSQPKTLAIYKYKPTRTPAALFFRPQRSFPGQSAAAHDALAPLQQLLPSLHSRSSTANPPQA